MVCMIKRPQGLSIQAAFLPVADGRPVLLFTVLGQLKVCAVRNMHSGIKMLISLFTSCVTLGKLLYFFEPQFLHL